MSVDLNRMKELDSVISKLRKTTEEAAILAAGNPAASSNVYMILRFIEMLETEISDPLRALARVTTKE